jgi:hypothetical protein
VDGHGVRSDHDESGSRVQECLQQIEKIVVQRSELRNQETMRRRTLTGVSERV